MGALRKIYAIHIYNIGIYRVFCHLVAFCCQKVEKYTKVVFLVEILSFWSKGYFLYEKLYLTLPLQKARYRGGRMTGLDALLGWMQQQQVRDMARGNSSEF